MELECELRALAAEIEWPATPALRPELAPRRHATWRARPIALALAIVAVAVAAAFAVPQSRGAILRIIGLGAVHVEFVDHLPSAQERPLSANLGSPISAAVARSMLGRAPLQPRLSPAPTFHATEGVVSLLFLHEGHPVLLSELARRGSPTLKKVALASTNVRWVRVGNDPAIWMAGARHVVVFPHAAARLAGHVLIWQDGDLTLRLESAELTLRDALALAARIH